MFVIIVSPQKGYLMKAERFALQLRRMMDKLGLSAKQLADKVGLDVSTIYKYLNDDRTPDVNQFQAMCKKLEVYSCDFLEDYQHGPCSIPPLFNKGFTLRPLFDDEQSGIGLYSFSARHDLRWPENQVFYDIADKFVIFTHQGQFERFGEKQKNGALLFFDRTVGKQPKNHELIVAKHTFMEIFCVQMKMPLKEWLKKFPMPEIIDN